MPPKQVRPLSPIKRGSQNNLSGGRSSRPGSPSRNKPNAKTSSLVQLSGPTIAPPEEVEIPAEDLEYYKEVFLLFDKDGNGSIDMGELKDAMQSIGVAVSEDEAKRMIGRIDMDKTETVDMPEFCKMMYIMKGAGFGGFRTSEELREAFVAMDIGGDGVISPADLIIVMDGLGERMSQEEALEWIKYVDSDADGVVGFEDFAKLMLEDS